MSDILSAIEKTLNEDPTMSKKKSKKQRKQKNLANRKNELRQFNDLDSFRGFLKAESLDDYQDTVHAQLDYYPPFVLQSCHNDPEKIKDSMNKNNKKFVRHLTQHVNKHLIADIKQNTEFGDEMEFKNINEENTFDKLVWHYVDSHEHEVNGQKFKIEMDVECHNTDANVHVDYRAYPC